jgi:hypothetical protein
VHRAIVARMNTRQLVVAAAAMAAISGAACGSDNKTTTNPKAKAAAPRITSSIRDGADLAGPVRWQARINGAPAYDVESVRFLIDGKVRHVEHETPYLFAGSGNRLLPGTHTPGSHTFAVDARLTSGHRLTAASTATVAKGAPAVPAEVLGRWTRTVTAREVQRADSVRKAEYGDPLPVGTWKVRIGADGVAGYIDPTPTHDLTVGQVRFEPGGGLVVGNEIPNFPRASEGGFCPDTVGPGRYRWSIRGGALVVHVVGDKQCADRNSFWNGTFTR